MTAVPHLVEPRLYLGAGAISLCTNRLLERAVRDVHAFMLRVGVHPWVLESTGRVLLGSSRTPRWSGGI